MSEAEMVDALINKIKKIHAALAPAFSPETARFPNSGLSPSAGHCAVASVIAHVIEGGELVSANVENESHWYNRFKVEGHWVYIDITGDQYGSPEVQASVDGPLYSKTQIRQYSELDRATLIRARTLARKSGLNAKIPID